MLLADNTVVASFCIKPYKTNAMYAYRIAMHPDYQGTGIGKAICTWLKSYEQPVYLDCWNGNEYYRAFIRKMAVIGLAYFRKLIMKYAYFVSKKRDRSGINQRYDPFSL